MGEKYFISYTECDEDWATWIAGVLEEHDQTALLQAWDIHAGDNFISKMNEFIRECDVFIPILSQAYFDSGYCEEEWANVLPAVIKDKSKKIIPVKVTDVKADGIFSARVYITKFQFSTILES